MRFTLTNHHRKYFGIEPLDNNWDVMPWKDTGVIFFDKDVIKKIIYYDPYRFHMGYQEFDYNIKTNNRNSIFPKTHRGKEKNLTISNILKVKPVGFQFFCKFPNIVVYHTQNQITLAENYIDLKIENYDQLSRWIDNYIQNSPENHFADIEKIKNTARCNVEYRPGDFFAFNIDRYTYGFGRLLLDIHKLQNFDSVTLDEEHNFQHLMGHTLLVKEYVFASKTMDINLDELKIQKAFPSYYVCDNDLFYGCCPIIGYRPLESKELDFPQSFRTKYRSKPLYHIFQWGLAKTDFKINRKLRDISKSNYDFRGTSTRVKRFSPDTLAKAQNGNLPFDFCDLRDPDHSHIRNEIFKATKIDPNISYNEFCKITNSIATEELLNLI